MNDYILVAAVDGIIILGSYIVSRRFLRNGLLTKLIGIIMPSIGMVGYIAFVLGAQGVTVAMLSLVAVVGVSLYAFMIFTIHKMVVQRIQTQANATAQVITGLSFTSQEAAANAAQQTSSVSQISSTIEEIQQMSQTTSDASQAVLKVTGEAVVQGERGLQSVRDLVKIIDELAKVANLADVVDNLAEQSNLLSVNAGIEAAKAGDYGRGFAVVAAEVRNLAEQSKKAARQIREAVSRSHQGQQAVQSTEAAIAELVGVLNEASDKARQISGASLQQAAGINDISSTMATMRNGGEQTAASSRQISDAMVELTEVGEQLMNLVQGRR